MSDDVETGASEHGVALKEGSAGSLALLRPLHGHTVEDIAWCFRARCDIERSYNRSVREVSGFVCDTWCYRAHCYSQVLQSTLLGRLCSYVGPMCIFLVEGLYVRGLLVRPKLCSLIELCPDTR